MSTPALNQRFAFYRDTIDRWIPDRNASILVVAGSLSDGEVFQELEFKNVTISNLDDRMRAADFSPYRWSYQDAENLSFDDSSFDYVVVHAGLHHCYSPHRALLEMYRVAGKAAILFESRDSLMIRISAALGFTQTYETSAVYKNDCRAGGVANTSIPNYIYRWTEREIEKTICSFEPRAGHRFQYRYGFDIPRSAEITRGPSFKTSLVRLTRLALALITRILPRQQNLLASRITKANPEQDLFPWLEYENGETRFKQEWGEKHFQK